MSTNRFTKIYILPGPRGLIVYLCSTFMSNCLSTLPFPELARWGSKIRDREQVREGWLGRGGQPGCSTATRDISCGPLSPCNLPRSLLLSHCGGQVSCVLASALIHHALNQPFNKYTASPRGVLCGHGLRLWLSDSDSVPTACLVLCQRSGRRLSAHLIPDTI